MLVILKPTQVMFHKPKRSSYGTLVVQKKSVGRFAFNTKRTFNTECAFIAKVESSSSTVWA